MAIASSLRSFSTALFLHSPHSLSLCLSLPPSRCLAAREERKSPSAPFSLWEEHQWISRPNCVGQREVGSWVRRTSPRISLPTPIKAPVVSPPPSPSQWPVACVGAGTNQNTQAAQVLFGLSCLSVCWQSRTRGHQVLERLASHGLFCSSLSALSMLD